MTKVIRDYLDLSTDEQKELRELAVKDQAHLDEEAAELLDMPRTPVLNLKDFSENCDAD